LLAVLLVIRVGMMVLERSILPSGTPKLIDGMVDGKHMLVIPQDPKVAGAIMIPRSNNMRGGVEFTWSVWMYVDDMTYNEGKYRCVFYKGNDYAENKDQSKPGMNFPNNSPGLYIAPNTNDLVICMNTFNVIGEEIRVRGFPLNKWMNVLIRCSGELMDVYINGTVSASRNLHGVPKQNYGDVYVSMNGGFSGYTSNLWYYNYALSISQIQALVKQGPNTKMQKMATTANMTPPSSDYLSLRWFMGF
jgi:hypothetical protein